MPDDQITAAVSLTEREILALAWIVERSKASTTLVHFSLRPRVELANELSEAVVDKLRAKFLRRI